MTLDHNYRVTLSTHYSRRCVSTFPTAIFFYVRKGILSTLANSWKGFCPPLQIMKVFCPPVQIWAKGIMSGVFFVRIQSSMYGMTSLGSSGSKQIIVWVETVQIMGWNVWTGEGWNVLISWVEVSMGWSVFIWNKGLNCLWVESSLSRTQYVNQQLL